MHASSFEAGLELLGGVLGFDAVRPNGQADPDGAWRDGTRLWVITEAKTEERTDTPLSVETVRQAATHSDWVANVLGWEPPTKAMTIIVSDKAQIDPAAVPLAGDLRLCSSATIREIAARASDALREARAAARGLSDEQLAAGVSRALTNHGVDDDPLQLELGGRRVADG